MKGDGSGPGPSAFVEEAVDVATGLPPAQSEERQTHPPHVTAVEGQELGPVDLAAVAPPPVPNVVHDPQTLAIPGPPQR